MIRNRDVMYFFKFFNWTRLVTKMGTSAGDQQTHKTELIAIAQKNFLTMVNNFLNLNVNVYIYQNKDITWSIVIKQIIGAVLF